MVFLSCTRGLTTSRLSKDGYLFISKIKPSIAYIQAGTFVEIGNDGSEWRLVQIC